MNPSEIIERLQQAYNLRPPPTMMRLPRMPRIEIMWSEYFQAFCEAHGKHPLFYRGRLLFPDAWAYSATEHEGPEYPPPEDYSARIGLMRVYWKLRRAAVRKEMPATRLRLAQLEELKVTHPTAELKYRSWSWDAPEDGSMGSWKRQEQPISNLIEETRQRIEWMEEDLVMCELHIIDPLMDTRQEGADVQPMDPERADARRVNRKPRSSTRT